MLWIGALALVAGVARVGADTSPTSMPLRETACPDKDPTSCQSTQSILTLCPVKTVCPVKPTQCPRIGTKCPELISRCPETPTACPCFWTHCPPRPTLCPEVHTMCPYTPTLCYWADTVCTGVCEGGGGASFLPTSSLPQDQSQCPGKDTECGDYTVCRQKTTHCPYIETHCPKTMKCFGRRDPLASKNTYHPTCEDVKYAGGESQYPSCPARF